MSEPHQQSPRTAEAAPAHAPFVPEASHPVWYTRLVLIAPLVLILSTVAILVRPHTSPKSDAVDASPPAPDFSLRDGATVEGDDLVTLSHLVAQGPVLLIFHIGFYCPPCVEHLRKIADHIDEFETAGVQVVAISPDSPDDIREAILSWGEFPFPLLSDRDNAVARAYGLETNDGMFLHGSFVIDKQRRIRFAGRSADPVGEVSELLDAGEKAKSRG